MSSDASCVPDDPEECIKQGVSEHYWIYLVVYAVVLSVVYVPVLLSQSSLGVYRCLRRAQKEAIKVEKGIFAPVRASYDRNKLKFAKELALGEHTIGNFIIIGSLIVNTAYFGLYWRRTVLLSEVCLDQYSPEWQIEVIFSTYFLLYFCLRLFGGYNRREFWLDRKTMIDLITVPHIFVSIALDRDWLGFRFLRILWFNHIIDLLKQLSIFKSQRYIDILSLLSRFVTFWLASAGAIHLLEVTGDPWHDFRTRRCSLSFADYIYFLIVTITTVGYGDISPKTELGRIFVSWLIIAGLILVAYATPTISELFASYSFYSGSYSQVTDAKHIVVSGYVTADSVKYFLSDFLHPDRKDDYTKILLLHPKEPDHDLKGILRKHFRRVKYFKGSVLNSKDLLRVKIKTATAAVILAPNYSLNPESEDESNLMRVVSIKNTCNYTKVIIQLLQLSSLQQIVRIPSWHPSVDTAICTSRLKLGLMAQNCLCPGISTLLCNLIYTTSESKDNQGWITEYSMGAGNELYKKRLPEAFYGMTYEEAARMCFLNPHLHIMLLAIDATPETQEFTGAERRIHVAPFGFTIDKGMSGYFVAQNEEEVLALDHITADGKFVALRGDTLQPAAAEQQPEIPLVEVHIDDASTEQNNGGLTVTARLRPSSVFSTSNLFHVCQERDFETALLENPTDMVDHVILCTFSLEDSDELNLHSFVSPLRACTLQADELMPIVIIGNKDCIQSEWGNIAKYDKVFVIDGCPLDQDVLKFANVAHCSSCIILGSTASLDEDPALIDKQPILCSLTLTSLDFSTNAMVGDALSGKHLHKVTELYQEENVQFLDLEDEDDDAEGFINSQPYAQGECISTTVYDSLVAVAYFNPGSTALFEKLVTGGSVNQAKPKQKKKTRRFTVSSTQEPKPSLYRPRFLQISLLKPKYEKFQHCKFSVLFDCLLGEKKLCVGIYRRIMEHNEFSKRYVVTSPPHNLVLRPTDNIFILISYK